MYLRSDMNVSRTIRFRERLRAGILIRAITCTAPAAAAAATTGSFLCAFLLPQHGSAYLPERNCIVARRGPYRGSSYACFPALTTTFIAAGRL
jgi:hypothetical protein